MEIRSRKSQFVGRGFQALLLLIVVGSLPALRANAGFQSGHREVAIHADETAGRKILSGFRQEEASLVVGRAVTGRLRKGETITFDIMVPKPNQFIQVRIKQRGTDIGFVLRAPSGQSVTVADKRNSALRERSILEILSTPGTYRLAIYSLIDSEIGCYEVRLEQLRDVDPKDKNRIDSYKAFAEAELLKAKRTSAALGQSIIKYQQALELRRPTQDQEEIIRIVNALGEAYYYSLNMTEALKFYEQAEALSKDAKLLNWEGEAVNNEGTVYVALDKKEKALEFLKRALQLRRSAPDHFGEIDTLTNLGYVYFSMGDGQNSEETYRKALDLIEEPCDRYQKAPLLNNFGSLLYDQGNFLEAIDYYLPSLSVMREMGDETMEAGVLNNLGTCYHNLGEGQAALDYYNRALPLVESKSDQMTQGTLLNNIGLVYSSFAQHEMALRYFNDARRHWVNPPQPLGMAFTLEWIGGTYTLLGRSRQALAPLLKAKNLFHESKDNGNEAYALAHLADAYGDLGRRQKALALLIHALSLVKDRDPQAKAYVLIGLGEQRAELGQFELALTAYKQAFDIVHASKDIQQESTILYRVGLVERSRGNFASAHENFQKALDLIESVRANVISHSLRASYLSSKQIMYNATIDLLMQWHRRDPGAGHDAEALHTAERSRARSLTELLTEARADLSQGIKPELLVKRQRLQQQITAKTSLRELAQDTRDSEAQIAKLNSEIAPLSNQLEQVEAQIKVESPRYAALIFPEPLNADQIRKKVVDPNTVLLEYKLGSERSYLWVVTSDSIKSFELPKRGVVEALARRVRDHLTERGRRKDNESLTSYDRRAQRADRAFYPAAKKLSRMLLGPAAAELNRRRLLVVSEGMLQYIPFAVLPIPNESFTTPGSPVRGWLDSEKLCSSPTNYCPMVGAFEIVTAASASTIAVLEEEFKDRPAAPKTIAAFADPVIDLTDERIDPKVRLAGHNPAAQRSAVNQPTPETSIVRSLRRVASSKRQSLGRLRYSEDEAKAIEDLVPTETDRWVLRGFSVNHRNATSSELENYRFIHFSTHGLLDSYQPELSGIFLSLRDPAGRFQDDGILRLGEVYGLRLNADVVTLSACETGLGRQVDGEGIIGLTRGFMYAGSRSVVASLWLVDDQATSELMRSFYGKILGHDNLPPVSALRKAQIDFWQQAGQTERASPYFWGAFVYQGLWPIKRD